MSFSIPNKKRELLAEFFNPEIARLVRWSIISMNKKQVSLNRHGLCSPAEREAAQSQWLDYQKMLVNREESYLSAGGIVGCVVGIALI